MTDFKPPSMEEFANHQFITGQWYEDQYKTPGSRYHDLYISEGIPQEAHDMNHYHIAWVIGLLALYPGKDKVLDLGSGCGYFLDAWERLGFECTGIEISEEAIARSGRSNIVLGNARDLSMFPDNSFDLCYSGSFLEHIDASITKDVIQESVRVARMGAHYIATEVGNDESHIHVQDAKSWLEELLSYIPEDYAVMGLSNIMSEHGPLVLIVKSNDAPIALRQISHNYGGQQ